MKRVTKILSLVISLSFMLGNISMAATKKSHVINYDYDTTATDFNYDVAGNGIRIYGSTNLATLKRIKFDEERGYVLSVTGNHTELNSSNKGYTCEKSDGGYLSIGDDVVFEFDMYSETGGMCLSWGGSASSSIGLFTPFYIPSGDVGQVVAVMGRNQAEFVTTASNFSDYGVKYTLGEWAHVKMEITDWTSDYKAKITLSITDEKGTTTTGKTISVSYYGSGAHAASVFDQIKNITFRGLKNHFIYFDNIELYTIIPAPKVESVTLTKYDGTIEETLDNASTLIKKIDVKFNMPMEEKSLSGIKLLLGDEPVETSKVSYDKDNNIYTLELKDVLNTGKEYKLVVPQGIENKHEMKAEAEYSESILTRNDGELYIISADIKIGENEFDQEIITDDSILQAEVKYAKTGDGKVGFVITGCAYNKFEGGEYSLLSGIEYENVEVSESEKGIFTKTVPLSQIFTQKAAASDFVKVFVLDGNNLKYHSSKNYN